MRKFLLDMTHAGPKVRRRGHAQGSRMNPDQGHQRLRRQVRNVNGSGSASANELFAEGHPAHGRPGQPAQHLPEQHPGPADLVRGARERARLARAARRRDMMVAMNPQTWEKDLKEIEPGGYLFYDSTRPIPRSKFREDITVIGVPLTEICAATYSDPKQRQLFKNIMYVGVLSVLLGMDAAVIEKLLGEQYKGKEKLLDSNVKALKLGREYAQGKLQPIGLQVQQADSVGEHIFVDGNTAAALGCVYGGATVCAWYPITPSSSLAEAFQKYCMKLRVDAASGKNKFAVIQAEDEIASIGMVVGRAGTARARSPRPRAGRVADDRVHRARLHGGDPGHHHQRAARRPVHRHAHAHAAGRHLLLRLRLARRHQARAAVPGGPARVLRARGGRARSRRSAADARVRDDRPRHRHEPAPVRAVPLGGGQGVRPRQGDEPRGAGGGPRLRPLPRRGRRRRAVPHLPGTHATAGSFFTRGTTKDAYARYSEAGPIISTTCSA
jgi:2-oxoglutarate ferredoxin oxidoreductase subunit alpha